MKRLLQIFILVMVLSVGLISYILGDNGLTRYYHNKLYLLALIILIGIYLLLIVLSAINDAVLTKKEEEERLIKLRKKIDEIDPNLDKFKLEDQIFESFKNIRKYYYCFDTENLKKYLTDKMYDTYVSLIKTLKNQNKNLELKDMKLDCGELLDISKNGNVIKTRTYMAVTSDIIEDGKTVQMSNAYMVTFIKVNSEQNEWIMANEEKIN